ncbi:Translation initiation factor IF-2 [Alphaproteobacteria bacterium]
MTEQNKGRENVRKVLGVNVNALAPKNQELLRSGGSAPPNVRGAVVVVMKGKSKPNEISVQAEQEDLGSLTVYEKEKRLAALRLAEEIGISNQDCNATTTKHTDGGGVVGTEDSISQEESHGENISQSTLSFARKISVGDNAQNQNQGQTSLLPRIDQKTTLNPNNAPTDSEEGSMVVGISVQQTGQREREEREVPLSNDSITTTKFAAQVYGKGKIRNLNYLAKKPEEISVKGEDTDIRREQDTVRILTNIDKKQAVQPASVGNNEKLVSVSVAQKGKAQTTKVAEEEGRAVAANRRGMTIKRHKGKLSAAQIAQLESTDEEKVLGMRNRILKRPKKGRYTRNVGGAEKEKVIREVVISDTISVQELAVKIAEKSNAVVKALLKLGIMVNLTQSIDGDTAEIIALEFGHKPKRISSEEILNNLIKDIEDTDVQLQHRPPIVTIMGHVDHGKTSLLDALHSTDIAVKEHGGITQHIGAYKVTMQNGKSITFLDTPGHEAFTAMRMRGAQVTDIVVLVVAADDGIKAQTIEAISHAKAANVPIVVAINKIDRPNANFENVKNMLLHHDLIPDDMGGDVMVVGVSAKDKIGLDKLEEVILLQAELLELTANVNRNARGRVLEAQMHREKGVSATFLVLKGTMHVGDIVVAGKSYGRVRAMKDDKGVVLKAAIPSTPVEVTGLNDTPTAGDEFIVVNEEKIARQIVEFRVQQAKERKVLATHKSSLEQLFNQTKAGVKELPIIIKADVHGSAEAIVHSLEKIEVPEIKLKILHCGAGGITESDVTLAAASRAVILGFNVRANNNAKELVQKYGIDVRYYSIIYDLIHDVKAAMSGLLEPVMKESIMGYAEIRRVFEVSKVGKIAGCYITEGVIKRHASARLLRDNIVIHEGKLKSLRRMKDDVKEVKGGFECGLSFEKYDDIKEKDIIEAYELVSEQRKI